MELAEVRKLKIKNIIVKDFKELADLVIDGIPVFPAITAQASRQIGLFGNGDEKEEQDERGLGRNEAVGSQSHGRTQGST
jgi:hypothetical protein